MFHGRSVFSCPNQDGHEVFPYFYRSMFGQKIHISYFPLYCTAHHDGLILLCFWHFFHSNIQLQVVPFHSLSGSLMMGDGDGFYDDGLYYDDDDDGCIMLCHFCVSFPVQLAGICCLNPPAKRCSKWLK